MNVNRYIFQMYMYIFTYKNRYVIHKYIYNVYTQTDADRHVILHVSMALAPPSLPEHYDTPVSQQQPLHRAVIQAKDVGCVTFFAANSNFSKTNSR